MVAGSSPAAPTVRQPMENKMKHNEVSLSRSDEYKRLSKSGWTLRSIWIGKSAWLDYEGIQFKRSQKIIVINGEVLYDWPEIVPEGVKKKIDKILLGE